MQKNKVKETVFKHIAVLPTLPHIVHEILQLVQKEDSSVKELGALIANDTAISSRLLKVANSAYYGFMRQIDTLEKAVVVLGYEEVQSLALGIAVFHNLQDVHKKTGLEPEQFWLHSLGCALIGQDVSQRLEDPSEGVAFTACLLHDVGKLIISCALPEENSAIHRIVESRGCSILEAEKEIIGFDHSEVGFWLCEKWKLPRSLTVPIRYHHGIAEADDVFVRTTAIVHGADVLCRKARIGSGGDSTLPPVDEAAHRSLGTDDEYFDSMLPVLAKHKDKAAAFLEIQT